MNSRATSYLLHVGDLKLKNGDFWENVLCIEFNETGTVKKKVPAYTAIFLNWTERLVVPFGNIKSFKRERKPVRNFIMKDN